MRQQLKRHFSDLHCHKSDLDWDVASVSWIRKRLCYFYTAALWQFVCISFRGNLKQVELLIEVQKYFYYRRFCCPVRWFSLQWDLVCNSYNTVPECSKQITLLSIYIYSQSFSHYRGVVVHEHVCWRNTIFQYLALLREVKKLWYP